MVVVKEKFSVGHTDMRACVNWLALRSQLQVDIRRTALQQTGILEIL